MLGETADHGPPDTPRATLVAIAGELGPAALLMGGAHTLVGNDVLLEHLGRAWVIDCAGDLPGSFREQAARFELRVFPDLDGEVAALERLRALAREVALGARDANGGSPDRIYVMCQHGLNRSGLVTGLLLRELGLTGSGALERILRARPGSLSNRAFREIVERG